MSNSSKENVKEEIDKDEKDKQIDFYKKTKGKKVKHYIISEQRDFYKKKISELDSTITKLNSTIESRDKEVEDLKRIIENLKERIKELLEKEENQNEIKTTKIIQKEVEESDVDSYLEDGWKEVLAINHSKTIIEKEVPIDEFP